jgi:ligand-binding sensor domain-containing protein
MTNRPVAVPLFISLSLLLFASAAWGGPWKHLTDRDGLPSNEIQFIKEAPDGTIWIGTLRGLVRHDRSGIKATPITGEAWDVLPVDGGAYFVGTGSGVVRVRGDTTEKSLAGNTVAPLVRFGKSTVLALSKNRGSGVSTLVASIGGEFQPVKALASLHASDMTQTSDGKVWVSVEGRGVYVFDPAAGLDKVAHHLSRQNVTTVTLDSKGRVWCGLWGRGLAVYENSLWSYHLTDKEMYAFAIREGTDGTIWVATDQAGLWRYDGDQWTGEMQDEGAVNLLEVTSDGRVWISTQSTGGLRYFDGKTWKTSLPGPLPIRCLIRTRDGQLMAGGVLDGVHVSR